MTANGFFEHSIHNQQEQFGNMVQIWSTYESRHNANDAKPFARGINSFQLLNDGKRYWIVNIFWDAESPDQPIPAQIPAELNIASHTQTRSAAAIEQQNSFGGFYYWGVAGVGAHAEDEIAAYAATAEITANATQ